MGVNFEIKFFFIVSYTLSVLIFGEYCEEEQPQLYFTRQQITDLCARPSKETEGYYLQQTMYRIRDPLVSIKFYTEILGMTLFQQLDFETFKFSVFFLGYANWDEIPVDHDERTRWCLSRQATVELMYLWGSEKKDAPLYHNGNEENCKGYGHIGIGVPNFKEACERFERLGVRFQKRCDEGQLRILAYIYDPDDYLIEFFAATAVRDPQYPDMYVPPSCKDSKIDDP